jgi:hypothetical protein
MVPVGIPQPLIQPPGVGVVQPHAQRQLPVAEPAGGVLARADQRRADAAPLERPEDLQVDQPGHAGKVAADLGLGGRPTRGDADAGASSATQGPTTVALVASPACKTAVDRANAMLASAVRLRGTLAELDRSLNDPANHRRPGRQVLERLTSSLQVGSGASARFDRALAAYRKVVDQCGLRAPEPGAQLRAEGRRRR